MKTDRASVQDEAQAAAEDGFGYWSKLFLALLAEKEAAERERDKLQVSRDQYRHDAEALLQISKAAADAVEAAEAARDARQLQADAANRYAAKFEHGLNMVSNAIGDLRRSMQGNYQPLIDNDLKRMDRLIVDTLGGTKAQTARKETRIIGVGNG